VNTTSHAAPTTSAASHGEPGTPRRGILYCHCAHARVLPVDVKTAVLDRLAQADVEFDAVPDLCEMAARADPRLRELAAQGRLRIAACYPRAVRWLFAAAGAELAEERAEILNMRTQTADDVAQGLLAPESDASEVERAR
jgi:heterodisulfide reductase subunit A-like polyferredoxin